MMQTKSYQLLERLDVTLNSIIQNPERDNPAIGYNALERKVNVLIEAPELKAQIQDVEEVGKGFYSGRISVDYLQKLASREDIETISAKPVQQNR